MMGDNSAWSEDVNTLVQSAVEYAEKEKKIICWIIACSFCNASFCFVFRLLGFKSKFVFIWLHLSLVSHDHNAKYEPAVDC